MLIPFIDSKLNKRCPRLGIQVFVFISNSANWIGILFVHSWKNVPKSETNFWQQCIITEQWNTVMTPNFAHKIVHSSAMYYQNLIIIHECSKKLLKMKNSKSFLNTSTRARTRRGQDAESNPGIQFSKSAFIPQPLRIFLKDSAHCLYPFRIDS